MKRCGIHARVKEGVGQQKKQEMYLSAAVPRSKDRRLLTEGRAGQKGGADDKDRPHGCLERSRSWGLCVCVVWCSVRPVDCYDKKGGIASLCGNLGRSPSLEITHRRHFHSHCPAHTHPHRNPKGAPTGRGTPHADHKAILRAVSFFAADLLPFPPSYPPPPSQATPFPDSFIHFVHPHPPPPHQTHRERRPCLHPNSAGAKLATTT